MATRCKFRGSRGILCDVLKIDGSLARNIDFEVANFQVLRKTRRKTSILKLQSVKIGGSLAQNARFGAPTCRLSLWFSCGVVVSMGEAGKPLLFECVQAGCHVVFRGRRGTLWHSKLFDNVLKMSKLEDVSHEMLVFLYHASRLESLVFLWRRRVYGGSRKKYPFRRFPSRLSCRFAWQVWHFVTFQPVW